jgi:hypothetical protein
MLHCVDGASRLLRRMMLLPAFRCFSISAPASTLYSLTSDHEYFSLLSGRQMLAGGSTVYGNVSGGTVLYPGGTINGEVHYGGVIECGTFCGTATGGSVVNSAQHAASRAAWSSLLQQVNALTAKSSASFLLGATSFTSGVYSYGTLLVGSDNLVFDAQGDPNAQFVVRVDNMIQLFGSAGIVLVNGAQARSVLFTGGFLNLSASNPLAGVFYARDSVGRAGNINDTITIVSGGGLNFSGTLPNSAVAAPEPSSVMLILAGGIGMVVLRRRRVR